MNAGYIPLLQFAILWPYAPVFVSEYFQKNHTYRILTAMLLYIGSIVNCLFYVYIKALSESFNAIEGAQILSFSFLPFTKLYFIISF